MDRGFLQLVKEMVRIEQESQFDIWNALFIDRLWNSPSTLEKIAIREMNVYIAQSKLVQEEVKSDEIRDKYDKWCQRLLLKIDAQISFAENVKKLLIVLFAISAIFFTYMGNTTAETEAKQVANLACARYEHCEQPLYSVENNETGISSSTMILTAKILGAFSVLISFIYVVQKHQDQRRRVTLASLQLHLRGKLFNGVK